MTTDSTMCVACNEKSGKIRPLMGTLPACDDCCQVWYTQGVQDPAVIGEIVRRKRAERIGIPTLENA